MVPATNKEGQFMQDSRGEFIKQQTVMMQVVPNRTWGFLLFGKFPEFEVELTGTIKAQAVMEALRYRSSSSPTKGCSDGVGNRETLQRIRDGVLQHLEV